MHMHMHMHMYILILYIGYTRTYMLSIVQSICNVSMCIVDTFQNILRRDLKPSFSVLVGHAETCSTCKLHMQSTEYIICIKYIQLKYRSTYIPTYYQYILYIVPNTERTCKNQTTFQYLYLLSLLFEHTYITLQS